MLLPIDLAKRKCGENIGKIYMLRDIQPNDSATTYIQISQIANETPATQELNSQLLWLSFAVPHTVHHF